MVLSRKLLYLIQNKKYKMIVTIVTIITIVAISRFRDSNKSVKMAVLENNINQELDFIIVTGTRVTGYNWILLEKDANLEKYQGLYCKITGVTPNDLNLKYEFITSGNKYILYISDRIEFYDEDLGEMTVTYVVDNWDILYPVKHSTIFFYNILRTSKHITENDLIIN